MRVYSMSGPTVSAVLDGKVHGVVVQAKRCTGESPKSARLWSDGTTANCAVTLVSVTSL